MQAMLAETQAPANAAQDANSDAVRLFKAVSDGDLATVRELLPVSSAPGPLTPAAVSALTNTSSAPLSVNIADAGGFTPLIIASRMGHEAIVQYLVAHPNININAHTVNYNTAFLYACALPRDKGNDGVSIVKLLLDNGADFYFKNANNDSCLLCAATAGNVATVRFLFEAHESIQKAKAAHSAAGAGNPASRRWVTHRNEEGLTALMCATMSGSIELVKLILGEARRELGIVIPEAQLVPAGEPDALAQFYPSIWPEVLGPVQFDSTAAEGYVDPAPPVFLAFVNAPNLMGDTALHIAAQQQNVDLYLAILQNAGADPMKRNRRERRSFELFEDTQKDDGASGADGAASASSSSSSSPAPAEPVSTRITAQLEALLSFQRQCRKAFLARQASQSEKLFSELMDEEEERQLPPKKGGKAKKASTAVTKGADAGAKSKSKSKGAAKKKATEANPPVAEKEPAEVADAEQEQTGSEVSSPATSPRLNATAAPASASSVSASPALSPSAAPFVPMAAADATGWEVVASKAAKHAKAAPVKQSSAKSAPAAAAAPAASASVPQTNDKKASVHGSLKTSRKPKSHSKPANASAGAKKDDATAASTVAAPATATPAAAATTARAGPAPAAAPASTAPAYTLVPVTAAPASTGATAAPTAAAAAPAAVPSPSSSFFASFNTGRPRAWRPITALQPRRSLGSTDASLRASSPPAASGRSASPSSDSSAAASLSSLQSLFASLHPHIESTDLQLSHLLGSDLSSLSLSQLSVLDEVYASLRRGIRDTQFHLFQAQQQDIMSELVRTKSELHALRKRVDSREAAADQKDGEQ